MPTFASTHAQRGVTTGIGRNGLVAMRAIQAEAKFIQEPARGLSSWKLLPAVVAQIFAKALRWRLDRRAENLVATAVGRGIPTQIEKTEPTAI